MTMFEQVIKAKVDSDPTWCDRRAASPVRGTEPQIVAYGAMCDLVIDAQASARHRVTAGTHSEWTTHDAEGAAMRRAICTIVARGYRTDGYRRAWEYLTAHLTGDDTPAGTIVIGLVKHMAEDAS